MVNQKDASSLPSKRDTNMLAYNMVVNAGPEITSVDTERDQMENAI